MGWSIGWRISRHDFELWKNVTSMCHCLFGAFLPKKMVSCSSRCYVTFLWAWWQQHCCSMAAIFPTAQTEDQFQNCNYANNLNVKYYMFSALSHLFCKSMFCLEYTVQVSKKKKKKPQQLSSFMQWTQFGSKTVQPLNLVMTHLNVRLSNMQVFVVHQRKKERYVTACQSV